MNILLVEDEPDIAEPLAEVLRSQGHFVSAAASTEEAYTALTERAFDLAVLDVMLPEGEDAGFGFAESLRSTGFNGSILFLTARDSVADRIRGLDLGGDDYLVKPFSLGEFLARTRALLRRTAHTRRAVLEHGALRVDLSKREVNWRGKGVRLSEREFALLELFALYPERLFEVDELLERFFPNATSGTRVVRVYVNQLRQKIAPDVIGTVPGGYVLGPRSGP
ncbi:MAG: response regulator transcription factor [Trueperaceae bacterium]